MKRLFFTLSAACAAVSALAGDAAPSTPAAPANPEAAAVAAPAPAVEPYVLKSRSTFDAALDARAPFWPIGWSKGARHAPVKPAVKGPAAPMLQADQFTVSGVLLGNPAMATINGRSFAQGEVIPVVLDGNRLNLVLRSVQDGGVVLEYDDNVLFLPLRRQEVQQHAPVFQAQPGKKQELILDSGNKKPR
jgi:hypothetical protein